jgi:hypothetical protein
MTPNGIRSADPGPLLDPGGGPGDDPGDIWPTDETVEEAEFWDSLPDDELG